MAGSIAKAYVQVVPTTQGIRGKLTQAFNGEGKQAGTVFGSGLISKVKGAIAAAGIGKALSESIMAGANLEQSLGGIETLFKDSADLVIRNAEQAYRTAGMSANQYMETVTSFSASLLQSLGNDTEAAAVAADQALTDMADNANKMGTSMDMIQNAYQGFAKQNYTMLDNLKLGYGGTKSEMERLLADAQKLTGIEYNIDNLSDVYSAIHAIQEEMGIAGATAEEAAGTLSGSFASMKAAASDLVGNLALGRDIQPSLVALEDTVRTFLVDNLLPAVGNILSALPTVVSGAFSMAIRGMNLVANNADAILQQGIELTAGIGNAIITALPYLAEAALRIVSAIGNAVVSTDWIQVAQDTIGDLRTSLDLAAAEILGTDGNIVKSVLDAISANLPALLESGTGIVAELAAGALAGLPALLTAAGTLMSQLLSTILSMLPNMLSSGVSLIGKLATGLLSNIPAIITSAFTILTKLVATILSHLPDLLAAGLSLIGELAAGLIAAIPDLVASIPSIITSVVKTFGSWNWKDIGINIIKGIAKGITSSLGVIGEAAKNAAQKALKAAKDFLGIKSPSKRAGDEIGKFIPPGIAVGVKDNTKPLKDAMDDLSEDALDAFDTDLMMTRSMMDVHRTAKVGTGSADVEALVAAIQRMTDGNTKDIKMVVVLLEHLLEAVLGIEIGGEAITRLVDDYRRKTAIVRGGSA